MWLEYIREEIMTYRDVWQAILDFRYSVKLSNDDREGILRLSKLLYETGSAEQSLLEIRECLKLDPDHKDCFKHYKFIKQLVKLLNGIQDASKENRYQDCIDKSEKLKKTEPSYTGFANQYLCSCQTKVIDWISMVPIFNWLLFVNRAVIPKRPLTSAKLLTSLTRKIWTYFVTWPTLSSPMRITTQVPIND